MAAHPSALAWRIPWTEQPGDYRPRGLKGSDTTEALSTEQQGHNIQTGCPGGSAGKNPPAMQEILIDPWVRKIF